VTTSLSALILPDVRELIHRNDPDLLKQAIAELHPADVAEVLVCLDPQEELILFGALAGDAKVETFEHLELDDQQHLLECLSRSEVAHILDRMSSDVRADLFQYLPEQVREELFPLLAQAERNEVRRLLQHEEGTVGSIMSTEYATVGPQMSAAEAIQVLRREAPNRETIYTVYVVDEARRLVGVISLRALMVSSSKNQVGQLMNHEVISLPVDADQEEAAQMVAKYDFLALPIVDKNHRLVGIVTSDDLLDVTTEEATEDIQKGASVMPLKLGYKRAGAGLLYRRRVLWLAVLVLLNLVTSKILAEFQITLQRVISLSFFIPLLTGSGGNTGAQSATLMIRALATGEITSKEWGIILIKELGVGILLGTTLGVLAWGVGVFQSDASVGLVVGISMVVIVFLANLVGMFLPLLLYKAGVDPAVASNPLVSTITDVLGLLIYLGFATLVFLI
jgi:magnesium transporter